MSTWDPHSEFRDDGKPEDLLVSNANHHWLLAGLSLDVDGSEVGE
jgi:hypothetical protein